MRCKARAGYTDAGEVRDEHYYSFGSGAFSRAAGRPVKRKGGEYGIYIVMAAGLLLFFYGAGKLRIILDTARRIEEYIRLNHVYLTTLLKMAGITYIAEFASGICRDAGYGAMGTQIEIFARLSILALSMPVLLALLETLEDFFV